MNHMIYAGTAIIVFIALTVLLVGPALTPYTYYEQELARANEPPSCDHWMGTDRLGRDIFTRLCYGTAISLFIGLMAALLDMAIGVTYGSIAGYYGGLTEEIMMRLVDIFYSVPYMLIVILLVLVFEPGLHTIIIAFGLTGWMGTARIVRGEILRLKQQDFALAARAYGAGTIRLLTGHLLPNCGGVILTQFMLTVPAAIFGEAFLSFMGLGVPLPRASLGTMIKESLSVFRLYPYQLLIPSAVLCLIILGFTLVGDGLIASLNPRQKKWRRRPFDRTFTGS